MSWSTCAEGPGLLERRMSTSELEYPRLVEQYGLGSFVTSDAPTKVCITKASSHMNPMNCNELQWIEVDHGRSTLDWRIQRLHQVGVTWHSKTWRANDSQILLVTEMETERWRDGRKTVTWVAWVTRKKTWAWHRRDLLVHSCHADCAVF